MWNSIGWHDEKGQISRDAHTWTTGPREPGGSGVAMNDQRPGVSQVLQVESVVDGLQTFLECLGDTRALIIHCYSASAWCVDVMGYRRCDKSVGQQKYND